MGTNITKTSVCRVCMITHELLYASSMMDFPCIIKCGGVLGYDFKATRWKHGIYHHLCVRMTAWWRQYDSVTHFDFAKAVKNTLFKFGPFTIMCTGSLPHDGHPLHPTSNEPRDMQKMSVAWIIALHLFAKWGPKRDVRPKCQVRILHIWRSVSHEWH